MLKVSTTLLGLSVFACVAGCGAVSDETGEAVDGLASVQLRGVSLAGAEFGVDPFGVGPLPGTFAVNYIYPDPLYVPGYDSASYYLAKGMNTFRVPFRWERLQPSRHAAFDPAELARLTTTVNDLTAKGATVVLDPHNYARYGAALIGSSTVPNTDFADLWSRLALAFKGNAKVVFGLMNEPHDMSTEQWVSAANAALVSIRATGATNLVLVPGNGWTGASSWAQNWYGTPNSTALLGISDPGNNFAFEAHQYFDSGSSGTSPTCVSGTIGSASLQGFTTWLRANGRRGFLGEFGASSDPTCIAAIDDTLAHIDANSDVYLGWTYWAGGPWWGVNWMALEPTAGVDAPQMAALSPHLGAAPPPPAATCSDGLKNGAETGVDCGGTCAACGVSCLPTTYQAASMQHTVGGATVGGWSLWANGNLSTKHKFPGGPVTLTVTASGSVGAGVWSHMVVSVDNVVVGTASANTTTWKDYPFTVTTTAGTHKVKVAFDNDYAAGTEDRNLLVAKVVVSCASVPVPAPVASCVDGLKNGTETGVDCGGSCAACAAPGCVGATYPAATMTHSVGGAATGGWNLWSNGYAATNHPFTAGASTVTVSALGSVAASVWPHMVVSVGGVTVGSTYVQSTSALPYVFSFTAAAGSQEVRVTFDNDLASGLEDRNLTLQSVTVGCGAAGACVPTTCAAAAKTCGSLSDGCGATLTCGTCALPATCGGAGVANVCGGPIGPSGGTIEIMPLGDSITLGVNGGYRNGLWDRLFTAGKTIDYVGSQVDPYAVTPDKDHEGHPGFTIGNISASADSWLSAKTPDYVLLMIGTNDVAWWCAQTASQVADQNALLIDQILTDLPNAWVVVGSIPPLSSSIIQPNNVDRAQLGVAYNAELLLRVQTRIAAGKHVRFADVYASLTVADLYDGVHPTQAAADKVAQVWYDALVPILP